jgi:hypothetical protein
LWRSRIFGQADGHDEFVVMTVPRYFGWLEPTAHSTGLSATSIELPKCKLSLRVILFSADNRIGAPAEEVYSAPFPSFKERTMAKDQKKTTSRSLNVKPQTKTAPPDNMKKGNKVVKKR